MAEKKSKEVLNPTTLAEKKEILEKAISEIEKQYGVGSIMKFDENKKVSVDVIPTGCLPLDIALGVGGVPRGRIVEIYGQESSGKTTLTLQIIASAQKMGLMAAFIDAEHALDPDYAEKLGVQMKDLYISQPSSGEEALDIVDHLVRTGALGVIVVDSVAALTPLAEINAEIGAVTVGLQARLMSSSLRKLTSVISKSNTCVIFINQIRANVVTNPYAGGGGSPETTTGGKALKFYSSMRIEIKKAEQLKKTVAGEQVVYGYVAKTKVVKNKLAPPFKVATFDVVFGKGAQKEAGLIDVAIEYNVIKKSGSWFSYNDEKIGQGKDNAVKFLEDNPGVYDEIYGIVLKMINENKNQ